MGGWAPIAVALFASGAAWGAGWIVFYRAVARLVTELRAEVAAERRSRDEMLDHCLRAMADQRDDALRVLGDLSAGFQTLSDAVRHARSEGSTR